MFKALFLATLFVTLVVNIIFLLATKEKPPDLSTSTRNPETSSQRRLFLRSNDFYDYSSSLSSSSAAAASTNSIVELPAKLSPQTSHSSRTQQQQSMSIRRPDTGSTANPKRDTSGSGSSSSSSKPYTPTTTTAALTTTTTTVTATATATSQNILQSAPLPASSSLASPSERPKDSIDEYNYLQRPTAWSRRSSGETELLRRIAGSNGKPLGEGREFYGSLNRLRKSFASYSTKRLSQGQELWAQQINESLERDVMEHKSDSSRSEPSRSIKAKADAGAHGELQLSNSSDKAEQWPQQNVAASKQGDQKTTTTVDINGSNNNWPVYSPQALNIRVKSSRNHVFVSVDGIVIYESKSKSWPVNGYGGSLGGHVRNQQPTANIIDDDSDSTEGRGIHVIVLNEFDGYVMSRRVFDTYSPNQDEELCFFINMVRDGRLLIFAVKDEGSFKMPLGSSARLLLQKLGSRHIMKLRWRDMWAFVVRKWTQFETNARLGDSAWPSSSPSSSFSSLSTQVDGELPMNLGESLTKSSRFSDWAPPVILETRVELLARKQHRQQSTPNGAVGSTADAINLAECSWNSGNKDEDYRRTEFCSRIEGYGRVCDCSYPAPISFEPAKIANSQLDQVPIVVMASNRPYYLYRMLRSLLSVDGVNSSMVTVFIDGFYDEPLMVSGLFNLRAIQHRPLAHRSARISHHYKSSLTKAFELFPEAKFAIIFEEDLDVAQDALIYFNQTLNLLKHDSTLYCVSAWNDQGYEHSASDHRLLYRIETMPGLGWMLSRQLYKEELEPKWPSADQPHDWDMWIRTDFVRKGRECIIPDISRTFHFGATGTNINSYFQRQYFSKHAFSLVPIQGEFADLNKLTPREAYEELVEKLVSEAKVIGADDKHNKNNNYLDQSNSTNYLCSLANNTNYNLLASSLESLNRQQQQQTTTTGNNLQKFKQANELMGKNREGDTSETELMDSAEHSVIYIEMIDRHDFGNWLRLARCWRIWDLDARGQHNSMWRLFLNGQPLLIVGVPASPYSKFKPAKLKPFKII